MQLLHVVRARLVGVGVVLLALTAVGRPGRAGAQAATIDARLSDALAADAAWTADSSAIVDASCAWMEALRNRDEQALDTLMAEEYALGAPGEARPTVSKARWIANAMTIVETDYAAYPILRVRRLGPDVALASARLYWRARVRGMPIPSQYAITDVWVRRDGRWRVAARQGSLAPSVVAWAAGGAGAAVVGLAWLVSTRLRRRRRRRRSSRRAEATFVSVPA